MEIGQQLGKDFIVQLPSRTRIFRPAWNSRVNLTLQAIKSTSEHHDIILLIHDLEYLPPGEFVTTSKAIPIVSFKSNIFTGAKSIIGRMKN